MKAIRAAFQIGSMSEGWLGGLNYYRNIFTALEDWPERTVDPVLLLGRKAEAKHYREFAKIETVRSSCLDRFHPAWILRRTIQQMSRRDIMLTAVLRRSRIDLQSHIVSLPCLSPVPAAPWLPDFQHVHLPEFFTTKELRSRDRNFRRITRSCQAVILSSRDAQKDLASFDPSAAGRSHVLHFVASPPSVENVPAAGALAEKYQLHQPFFHLPNQMWAHKNHGVVVRALKILKDRECAARVVVTGNTQDHRQPDFFEKLMNEVRQAGVQQEFRVLGLVPYPDLIGIMQNSIALINPSLFEGWSSTVEESKTLGKRILLSDLAVHREQNPLGGLYFRPAEPSELATLMAAVLGDRQFDADGLRQRARAEFPSRQRKFAENYCRIVEKILSR